MQDYMPDCMRNYMLHCVVRLHISLMWDNIPHNNSAVKFFLKTLTRSIETIR